MVKKDGKNRKRERKGGVTYIDVMYQKLSTILRSSIVRSLAGGAALPPQALKQTVENCSSLGNFVRFVS